MKCPICNNTNPDLMGIKNGEFYCRKCIQYQMPIKQSSINYASRKVDYVLDYKLTPLQQEMSNNLLERYINNQSTSIKAVCGAGKTEIIYEVVKYALNNHQRVCFAVPRKELVLELSSRIKEQFINLPLSIVYGGHTNDTSGQMIICTTHQLFRFPQAFDLLILDEMDAFPYANNDVLENILFNSIRGQYIFMSATSSSYDNALKKRYHGAKLPIPKNYTVPAPIMMIMTLIKVKQYIKQGKPVLIYVPRIKDINTIRKLLTLFKIKVGIASSKTPNNDETISLLKQHDLDVIICTTILERGITISNIQVIVLNAQHIVYSRDTLIQIAGRVGRKVPYTNGEIIFLSTSRTKAIKECLNTLIADNA